MKNVQCPHTEKLRKDLAEFLEDSGTSITHVGSQIKANRTTLSAFLHKHSVGLSYETGTKLNNYMKSKEAVV